MEKNVGIKTESKGRIYRSRLEAKWASFFDSLGWKYEYEPIDLNGWIPDFMIFGHKPILVEVKPIYHFADDFDLAHELEKANDTDNEILVLGVAPIEHFSQCQIGWIRDRCVGWDTALIGQFRSCPCCMKSATFQQFGFMACAGLMKIGFLDYIQEIIILAIYIPMRKSSPYGIEPAMKYNGKNDKEVTMTDKEQSDFLNLQARVVIIEEQIKELYKIIFETHWGYRHD